MTLTERLRLFSDRFRAEWLGNPRAELLAGLVVALIPEAIAFSIIAGVDPKVGLYPEDIHHRLREARHGAIGLLAQAARAGGAGVVLLVTDTFDAVTPAPDTLRRPCARWGRKAI